MNRVTLAGLVTLVVLWPGLTQAQDAPLTGEQVYKTKGCMACHGSKGAKPILTYPALAGQSEKYVLQQINDIKSGKRVGAVDETGHPATQGMADILHILSDADIVAVSKYVAEQKPGAPKPLDPPAAAADLEAGAAAYKKLGCVTCHGVDGKKATVPIYPVLAGLNRDYLHRQMVAIRDGGRTSGQSKLMVPFAKKADDAAIAAISTWLSQIDRSTP